MNFLYRFCWIVIRSFMVLFCRLKILGAENIPATGGMILASNHVSAVDPPFLGSSVKRPLYFMAKKELFSTFILGPMIKRLNAFPVNRAIFDKSAMKKSLEILKGGGALIMFPEGTRSKNGQLGKAKPGIGMLARSAMVPVLPAYIHNSGKSYFAFLTGRRLIIRFGEPIRESMLGRVPDDKNGFREIAGQVMERIASLRRATLDSL